MRVNHLNLLILWNFGLVMVRSYCYQNPVISMNKNIAENLEMPETKQNTYSYTMYIYLDERPQMFVAAELKMLQDSVLRNCSFGPYVHACMSVPSAQLLKYVGHAVCLH